MGVLRVTGRRAESEVDQGRAKASAKASTEKGLHALGSKYKKRLKWNKRTTSNLSRKLYL